MKMMMHEHSKMKINVGAAARVVGDMVVEEPLSPRSALFAHSDSTYIVATIGFETAIDVDIFRENISNNLLLHPRFSSLLVVGGEKKSDELRWVHVSSVNLDNHIIVPSINPKILNTNSLEANTIFMEDYIHNLTKTSMDRSNPPWDVHVLNLKTSEAESVAIFRFHHALGDGTSLISLVLSCARQVSDPNALPTIPTMKKKKENVKSSLTFILAIWWWLQVIWNTTTGFLRFVATTFFLKDSDLIINADSEAKMKPRRIMYKTFSLDDIKLVKNSMNVTINDVALGIVEAGLSQYLIRKFSNGNSEEKKAKVNSFIEKLRMTITMAVNLRAIKGIQSLGDTKKKSSGTRVGLGNPVGFVLLSISLGSRDDPLAHIRKAKALCDRMKASFEAICNFKINEITTKLFGIKAASSMWVKYTSHVSVLFSNVPGPVEEIALFGHPIKFIAPSLYSLSTPVVIHFQSYVNKMTIVLSVREDTIFMEDPHQLCDDIVNSLQLCKHEINM